MPSLGNNYIVLSYPWSENSGGIIFQHNLVDTLNRMGQQAYLWRMGAIVPLGPRGWLRWRLSRGPMRTNPELYTPLARRRDLTTDSIVVYPELLPGNPLKANNVVRWLLYQPGLRHPFRFGREEMFFRAGEMCDVPELTGGAPDLYMWKVNPAYRNENRSDRKGVCYLIRKGNAKPRLPQTEAAEAICVDGMSHLEMNEVFNRCEFFYSYDEATMYSQFAAIAGCTSVVVPGMFTSREEWVANHPNGRYGVAYGDSPAELAHARNTRDLLLQDLRAKEEASLDTVRNFINLTQQRFWQKQNNTVL